MTGATLAAFVGIAILAYVTPGPDWFVVLPRAAASRRAGFVAALGVQSGLVVHMAAAALGVAALLLASAQAFTILKLVGAAYLVYLGITALVRAVRRSSTGHDAVAREEQSPPGTVYRQARWRTSSIRRRPCSSPPYCPSSWTPTGRSRRRCCCSGRSTSASA